MKRWSGARLLLTLLGCTIAVAAGGLLCLMVGSTAWGWPSVEVVQLRWESVADAALVGAALGAAGAAYQATLRNPLAEPYLLGVSSGASLLEYLWRLPAVAGGIAAMSFLGPVTQQLAAFVGALAAVAIVLGLAGFQRRVEPMTVILIGVILNAVNGSIYLLLNAVIRDLPAGGGPLTFLVGGLQTITPMQRALAGGVILAGWLYLLYLAGLLNVAGLDDSEAAALGVRIQRLRMTVLAVASLVAAAAVSISGPVGFVGLVCPHVARLLVGTDQRRVLPVATAVGALLLMFADAVSRRLSAASMLGTQLQVGVLTGLLGGPFFLWLLYDYQRERSPRVATRGLGKERSHP